MRISDAQKDKMPSTNAFVWFVPMFLFVAWLMKADVLEVHKWPVAAVGNHADLHECDAATICIMGWSLI